MDAGDKIIQMLEGPHEYKNGILTPDSTLMTRLPDGPDDHIARGVIANQVKRVLTDALSAKRQSFYAKGTVDIQFSGIDENGDPEEQIVSIPIKSIPEAVLDSESREYQSIAAEMPYKFNPTTGEHEADRDDPQFMMVAKRLATAQRELMYSKLLQGINVPVEDEDGRVVWSPSAKGTRDKAEAIRVLTDVMGITSGQIRKIVDAIEALTEGVARREDQELEKK